MATRVQVTYRPNPAYHEEGNGVPRLYATLNLKGFGLDETIGGLPIYFRHLERPFGPIRQVYSTCVAGLPVEKGNLNSLELTLDLYLDALIHFGRLPVYLFQVRDRAWPIYRLYDQLVTRYPGCPVFSGDSIGELRNVLAEHFRVAGRIRSCQELSVLALSRADLQLIPPICMFRAPGVADIPVFPEDTDGGLRLVAPVNARALSVPLGRGGDILKLHQVVGAYLLRKGVISSTAELTIRKLTEPTWDNVRRDLQGSEWTLAYHESGDGRLKKRIVSVHANGRLLVAVRKNGVQQRALHLGADLDVLRRQLGGELHREGRISSPTYVIAERAQKEAVYG